MSDNTRSPSNHAAAAAGDPETPSPTVTHHQEIVAGAMVLLDQVRAALPMLEPVTAENQAFVKRKRRVPKPFVNTAVGSLSLSAGLQSVPQLQAGPAQNDGQISDALLPLKMQLTLLLEAVVNTMNMADARKTTAAQKVYAVARGLALDPREVEVRPLLARMKKDRKSPARRTRKADEANPPASEPQGGPAAQT